MSEYIERADKVLGDLKLIEAKINYLDGIYVRMEKKLAEMLEYLDMAIEKLGSIESWQE